MSNTESSADVIETSAKEIAEEIVRPRVTLREIKRDGFVPPHQHADGFVLFDPERYIFDLEHCAKIAGCRGYLKRIDLELTPYGATYYAVIRPTLPCPVIHAKTLVLHRLDPVNSPNTISEVSIPIPSPGTYPALITPAYWSELEFHAHPADNKSWAILLREEPVRKGV